MTPWLVGRRSPLRWGVGTSHYLVLTRDGAIAHSGRATIQFVLDAHCACLRSSLSARVLRPCAAHDGDHAPEGRFRAATPYSDAPAHRAADIEATTDDRLDDLATEDEMRAALLADPPCLCLIDPATGDAVTYPCGPNCEGSTA